jgi:hypothetical protein
MAERTTLDITPETRLSTLLERFPELEAVLLGLSPAFARLRNPILRRTVARVATLRQVAAVAGVPLGTVVNELRHAAGLGATTVLDPAAPPTERPAWADPAEVSESFDATELIERGGHPAGEVMAKLARLAPGQSLELWTPFVPAPLVELARQKGYLGHVTQTEADRVRTIFHRP